MDVPDDVAFRLLKNDPIVPIAVPVDPKEPNPDPVLLKKGWHYYYGRTLNELPGNSAHSWLSNKINVLVQMQRILKSEEAQVPLMLDDLAKLDVTKLGYMDTGIILKNLDNVFFPCSFFMVLEKADYSFRNPEWGKYFPPLKSGPQALMDLHTLLKVYYKMYTNENKDTSHIFAVGQLVLVKFNVEKAHSDNKLHEKRRMYGIRRGVIRNIVGSECVVGLIDLGFTYTVPDDQLIPMPRPFHSVAPLAIKCSLHGVSPLGINWSYHVLKEITNYLAKQNARTIYTVNIIRDPVKADVPAPDCLMVNLNLHKINITGGPSQYELIFNETLTQIIINLEVSAQWNLFPSRPKLMAGAKPHSPEPEGKLKIPRLIISHQDAIILTPCSSKHALLPIDVIKRDLKKLFRLRSKELVTVHGLTEYLAVQVYDKCSMFGMPTLLDLDLLNYGYFTKN